MDKILDIVASVTKKSKDFLKSNLCSENLWDSLGRVEILLTIEEEFDIVFEQEEIAQMTTINKLAALVADKDGYEA